MKTGMVIYFVLIFALGVAIGATLGFYSAMQLTYKLGVKILGMSGTHIQIDDKVFNALAQCQKNIGQFFVR